MKQVNADKSMNSEEFQFDLEKTDNDFPKVHLEY